MNRTALLLLNFRCVALRSSSGNSIEQLTAKLRKSLIFIFFVLISALAKAGKVFDFTPLCQQAYEQINSLKVASGQQLINAARKENPDNLIPDILDNYIDFYVLFFNEDPAEYQVRMPHFAERLDRIEEGPENSPFYNFCRTIIYMQKASVEIKFGKQWSAGWDFKKAFSLLKENRKKFPDFALNNMIYGPMLVAAGTIPDGYKWMAGLFGIKGTVKDGVTLMRNFVNSNDSLARLFFNEASFYYCYVLFYIQNSPDEAFRYIRQKNLDLVNNHLLAYMAANLALNNKKTAYAEQIIMNRNLSPDYLKLPVWDFELAYTKMHHLALQEAVSYFQNFLNSFKGRFYVKDAWSKLSWCYYLQNNLKAAENARQQVLKQGTLTTDADKQAQKYAESEVWPNRILLKARILNDGGFNKEALGLLAGKSAADFNKPEDQLEFTYRVARIYDDTGNDEDAIKMYLLTIKLGQYRTEYYAARAALQIGLIYEKQGKKDLAITYFQKCIDMKEHEYKDSLDQKAKSGIVRCKEA